MIWAPDVVWSLCEWWFLLWWELEAPDWQRSGASSRLSRSRLSLVPEDHPEESVNAKSRYADYNHNKYYASHVAHVLFGNPETGLGGGWRVIPLRTRGLPGVFFAPGFSGIGP
ncbi:protein of unknown function [Magnetospirillum sp. XM-1]|nr:protein of unknown function [Magnetospirillum sp. XM-1]